MAEKLVISTPSATAKASRFRCESRKIRLARQLETLGVDIIEAGFPLRLRQTLGPSAGLPGHHRGDGRGLARCATGDIDRPPGRLPGSPIRIIRSSPPDLHPSKKLRMTRETCLTAATGQRALVHGRRGVSAEDATRSDLIFCRVVESAIDAAPHINLSRHRRLLPRRRDWEFFRTIITRCERTARSSAHCHDDPVWRSRIRSRRSVRVRDRSNARHGIGERRQRLDRRDRDGHARQTRSAACRDACCHEQRRIGQMLTRSPASASSQRPSSAGTLRTKPFTGDGC